MIIGMRAKPAIPLVDEGTYTAICVGIYDLGEQQVEWQGKTKYSNRVRITFELVGETVEIDGETKPRHVSREFSVAAGKNSNLRKFITAWRGKAFSDGEFLEFNMDTLLGRPAMVQIVHSEDGQYANVDGVMRLPKGMPTPTTETELHLFNIDDFTEEDFKALPDFLQEKVKNSTQYQQMHAPEDEVDFPEEEQEENPTPAPRARTAKAPAAKAGRGSARSAANPTRTTRNSTPTTDIEEEPPF